ncbi:thioesterase family protein (plasmid) [Salipiger sp. H15]|uniref:Thioesterase family protein n=1 Tax=Alloyangia sp. H15 TaxID=3029062 RepID=A0AAU8AR92_9RHOB
MSEAFTIRRQVEFNHCDPAGIVFYPRYFEMISAVQERFFADALGCGWGEMIAGTGMATPMGQIECRFHAPSRLGDWLDLSLAVKRLGSASATFVITCTSGDERRFTCQATVIHANAEQGTSAPWPAPLRDAMTRHLVAKTPD